MRPALVAVALSGPGVARAAGEPDGPCAAADLEIGRIQGSGETAVTAGAVRVEGVVVGDFEGPWPALRGFYLQDAGDGDPATSDGLFVFHGDEDRVELGDRVQVTGTVEEFQGQTQLSPPITLERCDEDQSVEPTALTLPLADWDELERVEGMLVRFEQPLYVTDLFQLGRFGQVTLSAGDRSYHPTSLVEPGLAARLALDESRRSQLVLDDAEQRQNPDPIPFGRGGAWLSADNTLRGGDRVSGLVGVMTYTWAGHAASGNAFRLRSLGALGGGTPEFVAVNPRPDRPPELGGNVTVATFNLSNYFDTFGADACTQGLLGPTTECRGASDSAEFERQAAKLVAALSMLDADVIALSELENDGYGPDSALHDLVERLNQASQATSYAFVDVDHASGRIDAAGGDAIKVGFLYRALVLTLGQTVVDDNPVHPRSPVAQQFYRADGGSFTLVLLHAKSKGCIGAEGADQDFGDGQGCYNAQRVAQAEAVLRFVETVEQVSGDPNVFVLGDFNAHALEDPLALFHAEGFVDVLGALQGGWSYTYAFDGLWGALDHVLASSTALGFVRGAASLGINADEPPVLDYRTAFKSAAQLDGLFEPDAFRSSDHDPIVVGLELPARAVFGGFLELLAEPNPVLRSGPVVPIRFSLGGDFGLSILRPGSPESVRVDCQTRQPLEPPVPVVRVQRNLLRYSVARDEYTVPWRTSSEWAGTCRLLNLAFADGNEHDLFVRFR